MNRFLLSLAILLLAGTCRAFPEYPRAVQQALDLKGAPDCTICHFTATGGKGTAGQRFAVTLRELGLPDSLDVAALGAVLAEMNSCDIDSDGDGVPDVQELEQGTNPNDGKGKTTSSCDNVYAGPTLETGCSVHAGRAAPDLPALLLPLSVLSLTTLFRRRRLTPTRRAASQHALSRDQS